MNVFPPILTSYFGALKILEQEGSADQLVPIVRFVPEWLPEATRARNILGLAPSAQLLRVIKGDHITWDEYAERFKTEVLAPLDRFPTKQLHSRLVEKTRGRAPILACWCKGADGQCHRHLVAEYFRNRGLPCWEYPVGRMEVRRAD